MKAVKLFRARKGQWMGFMSQMSLFSPVSTRPHSLLSYTVGHISVIGLTFPLTPYEFKLDPRAYRPIRLKAETLPSILDCPTWTYFKMYFS